MKKEKLRRVLQRAFPRPMFDINCSDGVRVITVVLVFWKQTAVSHTAANCCELKLKSHKAGPLCGPVTLFWPCTGTSHRRVVWSWVIYCYGISRLFFLCYSRWPLSHRGDAVPVNSLSSCLQATASHVGPGFAGFTPACHVRLRGRAWPSSGPWSNWIEVSHQSALPLCALHFSLCVCEPCCGPLRVWSSWLLADTEE